MQNRLPMPDPKAEGGFVLITVAALLVILIGFLALGVSTGYLYSARTTAQEIGDAAALAGAYTYITGPEDPTPGATAEYHAQQFALARAEILGIALDPADVTAVADVDNRRVEVTIASTQPTFFGTVLGIDTADIQTVSLAEAASVAAGESCTRPFFIPNNVFRQTSTAFCASCASQGGTGQDLIVFDYGDGNGYVPTPFAQSVINDSYDPSSSPDSRFRLYPGSPGGAIAPGQYYLIDLNPGENAGASDIADWIRGCAPENRSECGDLYSVKTGGTGGGVKNGLFGNGSMDGLLPSPPDTYDIASGKVWLGGDATQTSNGSPQLVIAPIWDVCDATTAGDYCTTGSIGTGTNVSMPIVGYALIFLEGPAGGRGGGADSVFALLLGVTGCGEISGTDDEEALEGSTVLSLPLRLVNDN